MVWKNFVLFVFCLFTIANVILLFFRRAKRKEYQAGFLAFWNEMSWNSFFRTLGFFTALLLFQFCVGVVGIFLGLTK